MEIQLNAENKKKKYMDSFLNDINYIYLKLKKKDYSELSKNDNIINIVEEIKKNDFSDVQLYVIAKLLCYLLNIEKLNEQKFIYPPNDRFNKKKMTNIWTKLFNNNFKNFNITTLNSKIQEIVKNVETKYKNKNENKKIKKIDIILRFIDEYLEVSKENSEHSKKLQEFLKNFEYLYSVFVSVNESLKKNIYFPRASNAFGISSQASTAYNSKQASAAYNSKQASAANNSRESFNRTLFTIQSYISALKSENIETVIKMIINSKIFSEEINEKIKEFLSRLFNYIIKYIDNEMLKKILNCILYFFVNQNMEIPKDILDNFGNTDLKKYKDKKLFEILNENLPPEFSKNIKLIKLFDLLSTQIFIILQMRKIKNNKQFQP